MSGTDGPGAPRRFAALVLAASRGAADPVARLAGVSHKALAPVHGVTMLRRVVETLAASASVGPIVVSAEDAGIVDAAWAGPGARGPAHLAFAESGASPSDSVGRAIAALDDPFPLLVTTADHPLLTPAMVDHFCAEAGLSGADVAAGVVRASVVLGAYPGTLRTFLRFRDDRYSGCNLFALMTPAALRAVEFWSRAERHRKRPWRLAAEIGPLTLALYLVRAMTLDQALARLAARAGARAVAVDMPFPEAAIDVDKPADLALAEAILKQKTGDSV